jgi:hypothetical protein
VFLFCVLKHLYSLNALLYTPFFWGDLMKQLIFLTGLILFFSGCCCSFPIEPPIVGSGIDDSSIPGLPGSGTQTDWCNSSQGLLMSTYYSMAAGGIQNVVVEGVKTVEGMQMCSIRAEFSDPDTGEKGSMQMYFTQDEENVIMHSYDESGTPVFTMKSLDGESEMIFYDESGNPVDMADLYNYQ